MATINFTLRKGKKEATIYLSFYHKSNLIRYNTGYKIDANNWQKNQRVKDYPKINKKLNEIYSASEVVIEDCMLNHIHLTDTLFSLLIKNQLKIVTPGSFFDAFDAFIIAKRSQAINTRKGYKTCKNKLINFEKKEKYPLTFSSINMVFYDKFQGYHYDLGHLNNYLAKNLANVKRFMR